MNEIALSVLMCSVHTRYATFLPKMMDQLFTQYNALPAQDQRRVEILVLVDNKKRRLGVKRNQMIELAQGEYVVAVDDDDRIADDYVSALLAATASGADCIVFHAEVRLNGGPPKVCYFSKDFAVDRDEPDAYYRIPHHISCVKKSLAPMIEDPPTPYGSDRAFGQALLPRLKTEHSIDRVLYYYDFNQATHEIDDMPAGEEP